MTDFARWEARCKYYLQGFDAKLQTGAVLVLLDDEVYDLARSVDISAAASPSVVLDCLREILGSSEHPWVLQADFHRRYQQPGESINDFQQAFRLLVWRGFPHTRCEGPEHSSLARDREEEVLQAACEKPPRSLFGLTAVQPHSAHDASTQTLLQSCSCGSSPRRNNWRRPQTRRPNKLQARRTIEAINAAPGPSDGENANHSDMHVILSHQDYTQIVEHYLEVPPEGGYALPEVFNNEQQVEKLVEVPPEGGSATELVDAAENSRALLYEEAI
ncbi:unnamed protein product [Schistocephalus solidus]|uniref:Myosin motor domain-containing protein n=1 Tax=Schistocephalus solidus TaxID=70667 RepID=A0A183SZ79_SCHSO|nr:unnamed protein product [Schistocephalus solidus]